MEWSPTRIPKQLFDGITQFIREHPELGYLNEHDLVRDAVREKIERMQKQEKQKEA